MNKQELIIEKDWNIKLPLKLRKHLKIKPGDTINYTLENMYKDGKLDDNVMMIKKPS
jgi:hypothetical protein